MSEWGTEEARRTSGQAVYLIIIISLYRHSISLDLPCFAHSSPGVPGPSDLSQPTSPEGPGIELERATEAPPQHAPALPVRAENSAHTSFLGSIPYLWTLELSGETSLIIQDNYTRVVMRWCWLIAVSGRKYSKVSTAERGPQLDWTSRWELSLPVSVLEGTNQAPG